LASASASDKAVNAFLHVEVGDEWAVLGFVY
jgi:hypothetical protein